MLKTRGQQLVAKFGAACALFLAAVPVAASAQLAAPAPSAPAPTAAAASSGAPSGVNLEQYVLGVNDEVQVTIFGVTDQVVKTRIKEDGTITIPYAGSVNAKGKTALRLAQEIQQQLKSGGYLVNPIVNVDVTQFVSNVVTVSGNVGSPGIYPLDRSMTVAMLIARAGGPRADGADFALMKRNGDASEHRVTFDTLAGDWSGGTALQAGDSLMVPPKPYYYAYGMVAQPGKYPIDPNMTVRQALARAGGPTLAGTQKKTSIVRGDKTLKKVPLDSLVQPNDTLYVNERTF
jgi:polysaccharide biosynthesis/export protein